MLKLDYSAQNTDVQTSHHSKDLSEGLGWGTKRFDFAILMVLVGVGSIVPLPGSPVSHSVDRRSVNWNPSNRNRQ